MLILLPVACFIFLWSALTRLTGRGVVDAALVSITIFGVFTTLSLQPLSAFSLLLPSAIIGLWIVTTLLAGVLAFQAYKTRPHIPGPATRILAWTRHQAQNDKPTLLLTLLGAGFLLVSLTVAIIAPPNAWDGLTYHLPRVMHWLQNQTLAHYPTHILRQLWMNPYAEEAALHTFALSGSDRFANCVQWVAYLFSGAAAWAIANQLGANSRGAALAWLFALSVPIVVLQASGPQTDVVTGCWLLITGYFTLGLIRPKAPLDTRAIIIQSLLLGAALGLACLTKGTSYLYGTAIALALFVWTCRGLSQADNRKNAAIAASLITVVFLIINGAFLARNLALFSKPFGPGVADQQNAKLSPAVAFSNMIRTLALQIAPPGEGPTVLLGQSVIALHDTLGLDAHDPGTSFEGRKFQLYPMRFHEDTASNPLQLFLALACCFMVLFTTTHRHNRPAFFWVLGLALGLLLFFTLIRWQPWSSRLLIPIYLLAAPIVGLVLSGLKRQSVGLAAVGFCAAVGAYAMFSSETRPIYGIAGASVFKGERMDHYIVRLPDRATLVPQQLSGIQNQKFKTLGLVTQEEDFEYLAWLALEVFGHPDARIEHVKVENASKDAPMKNKLAAPILVYDMSKLPR